MNKTKKTVFTPIATLTLIKSLIGGARAATIILYGICGLCVSTAKASTVIFDSTNTVNTTNWTTQEGEWVYAASFRSTGSYNEISVFLPIVSNTANDFRISIFSNSALNLPDNHLLTLSGLPNPTVGENVYWGNVTLLSGVDYWLLAEVSSGSGNTTMQLTTDVFPPTVGTSPHSDAYMRTTGDSWIRFDSPSPANRNRLMFRIEEGLPVPEASSMALLGLGCLSFVIRRCRKE